jgi:hypothetical protein
MVSRVKEINEENKMKIIDMMEVCRNTDGKDVLMMQLELDTPKCVILKALSLNPEFFNGCSTFEMKSRKTGQSYSIRTTTHKDISVIQH